MSSALLSALNAWSVFAVLLAVGVGVACLPRDGTDLEAIEAAARRPSPLCPPESREFRLPGPADYPLVDKPWISSREEFIAYLTRGEDPDVVRRHVEGPEEELIDYLGEVFNRPGRPYPCGPTPPTPSAQASTAATPDRPPTPPA